MTLSAPKPDDKTLRVHPIGVLSVREKIVPLDLPITRYGNASAFGWKLTSPSATSRSMRDEETKQNSRTTLPPGQFLTLSDADKVSASELRKIRCRSDDRLVGYCRRLGFAAHRRL